MHAFQRRGWLIVLLVCLVGVTAVWAQQARRPTKRVKPKKFDRDEVSRVFFDNVFDVLVGERPALDATPAATAPAAEAPPVANSAPASSAGPAGAEGQWAAVISATTIEDEIKAIKLLVDKDVSTPGDFKGRGYNECRRHFSVAAMLFAIIQEYESDVRWKDSAAAGRDLFARTAANAKVGTSQVFNEAKLRKTELADLLNGVKLSGTKEATAQNDWATIADRAPLMKRLEMALDGEIKKLTANEGDFKSNKDKLIHEAEIIAAIGTVLGQAGMEDGDDETYREYLQQMTAAARAIVESAEKGDYELSRKSTGVIDQACSVCHESYRG